MSRSLAKVVATLSYGETQFPDVALHELSVTTFVPSRFKTARTKVKDEQSHTFTGVVVLQ